MTIKKRHFRNFRSYLEDDYTAFECVSNEFYHLKDVIEVNGMEKLAAMVCGMLFQMKYNNVDPDFADDMQIYIEDFETGNYDD